MNPLNATRRLHYLAVGGFMLTHAFAADSTLDMVLFLVCAVSCLMMFETLKD